MKLATYRAGRARTRSGRGRGARQAVRPRRRGAYAPALAGRLSSRCWRLIDADDAGLDERAGLSSTSRGGDADLWTDLAHVELLAPLPRAAADARRDVVRAAHPPVRPRGSRRLQRASERRRGGVHGRDAGAAGRTCRRSIAQLPIYYITNRFTVVGTGRDRPLAALQPGHGLRARGRRSSPGARAPTFPSGEAAAHIFGYTIFNDFSARDRQASKCKAVSDPPRARASTAATCWGPGS